MNRAIQASVLLSAQLAWAQDDPKVMHYAKCELSNQDPSMDSDDVGIEGTLLFVQEEDDDLDVYGILDNGDNITPNKGKFELNYLAVREIYNFNTCQEMGRFWPEFIGFDVMGSDECALGAAKFDKMGDAIWKNKGSPASIYGDASIIGRGVSVHGCKTPLDESGAEIPVEACCQIEPISEE